jgi:hypothetical protein
LGQTLELVLDRCGHLRHGSGSRARNREEGNSSRRATLPVGTRCRSMTTEFLPHGLIGARRGVRTPPGRYWFLSAPKQMGANVRAVVRERSSRPRTRPTHWPLSFPTMTNKAELDTHSLGYAGSLYPTQYSEADRQKWIHPSNCRSLCGQQGNTRVCPLPAYVPYHGVPKGVVRTHGKHHPERHQLLFDPTIKARICSR